jgi:hypothetical protein
MKRKAIALFGVVCLLCTPGGIPVQAEAAAKAESALPSVREKSNELEGAEEAAEPPGREPPEEDGENRPGWGAEPGEPPRGEEPGGASETDYNTNYMALMIQYATVGNFPDCDAALLARNEKIDALGLAPEEKLTSEDFLENFRQYAGFDLGRNYLLDMMNCCIRNDRAAGLGYEQERDQKITMAALPVERVRFEELYVLSKVIFSEAGSAWLSMEWKLSVGNVLLNRVASPEFPDSLVDCVNQPGQYFSTGGRYFERLRPDFACVSAAAKLLSGERVIDDPSVVFQANFPQGSGVYRRLDDSVLGSTYLCYSSRPELYCS